MAYLSSALECINKNLKMSAAVKLLLLFDLFFSSFLFICSF